MATNRAAMPILTGTIYLDKKKKLFLSSTLLVFYQLFCSMYFICVYLVSIDDEIE